ncbi:hypothetical protein, partial [Desulfovibrio sp. OH1186_COT-070]|uniref:hypothetical protein n=1 Tax=unclassified Desulfovibrio TaxID=2593640 RepID=UPI003908A7E6
MEAIAMITIDEFDKVEVRAGTVLEVADNKKSRNPAYVLKIDCLTLGGLKPPALAGSFSVSCLKFSHERLSSWG